MRVPGSLEPDVLGVGQLAFRQLDNAPSSARVRTIKKIKKVGRRRWKKKVGYHRQALVENAFFRYKSIVDWSLGVLSPGGRVTEAAIACNVLNQITELGRPESYSIGR